MRACPLFEELGAVVLGTAERGVLSLVVLITEASCGLLEERLKAVAREQGLATGLFLLDARWLGEARRKGERWVDRLERRRGPARVRRLALGAAEEESPTR